jgi:hypothetical protein
MVQHPHDHAHDHDHDHDHANGHAHTHEPAQERRHVIERGAVLDIGGDVGALLVTTGPELEGAEIELYDEQGGYVMHTEVHAREMPGGRRYAGLFPSVQQGSYLVSTGPGPRVPVRVTGGEVAKASAVVGGGA